MTMPSDNERLSRIEERLKMIEARLGLAEKPAPAPVAPPAAFQPPAWRTAAEAAPVKRPAATYAHPDNWLGIVAVLCFVLAGAFIVKLSIDSGWLTHARQISLAALLGLGLIGTGLKLARTDRTYAAWLPGAGIVVLYLSVFAAHDFYHMLSFAAALGWTAAISGLCVWLYTRLRHDLYPLTAAVGSYAAPLLLGWQVDTSFCLYYFLVCSLAYTVLAVWIRTRTLILVSSYLAILMTGLTGLDFAAESVAIMLAIHFVFFTMALYLYAQQGGTTLTSGQAWAYLPVLLIFYALEYYFIDAAYPGWAPWVSIGFAALLIGLYLAARRFASGPSGSQALVLAYATLVGFHSVYLELLPQAARPWLLPALVLGLALLPVRARIWTSVSNAWLVPALGAGAIVCLEYAGLLVHLFNETSLSFVPVAAVTVISLFMLILRGDEDPTDSYHGLLLGGAHLLAIDGLYRLTDTIGSLAVSASWLGYGVAVIALGVVRRDRLIAQSALAVLGFAAGKALLYDAASAPTTLRILCLLLTGVVLYACGLFMRRTAAWNK